MKGVINVSWTPANASQIPIIGYSLKIFGDVFTTYTKIYDGIYKPDVLNTNLSGLVPNIPYQLVLTAYNFNGPSLDSPSVTVWACGLPSKISMPNLIIVTGTNINISWNQPGDTQGCPITGFAIYRDDGSSGSNPLI